MDDLAERQRIVRAHQTLLGRTCGHCGGVDCTEQHTVQIRWRSLVTGCEGHGEPIGTAVAEKVIDALNVEYAGVLLQSQSEPAPIEETRGLSRPCSFCRRPIGVCNADPDNCLRIQRELDFSAFAARWEGL